MLIVLALLVLVLLFHAYLHLTNPYARYTIFKSPYRTHIDEDGVVSYEEMYRLRVYGSRLAGLLGYYKSGFLIIQNTFAGGRPARSATSKEIISQIHQDRFSQQHPYLISGDQFSVLYPRNLGVFYNQLLDPNTAHDQDDWNQRQAIYLRSVLIAIDGLSASSDPRTTIVPIGPRHAVLTQVHPGGVGSDQVYGLLYALQQMAQSRVSRDGSYRIGTEAAVRKILSERREALQQIIQNYQRAVQDDKSMLVRQDLHLASARDGVIRSSSFYDNVILWKTLSLARELKLIDISKQTLHELHAKIDTVFWNEDEGFYNDDSIQTSFSADWLIGFPTGFFDLANKTDLSKARRIVEYIERTGLASPFPIKYQVNTSHKIPFVVKLVIPAYGGDVIWSYWGSQYMTLLLDLYEQTKQTLYLDRVRKYCALYDQKIRDDKGFAETYDKDGVFLKTPLYKSIRITGWVVQYEHVVVRLSEIELSAR